jgi:prolyl-tRNA synthetase
MKKDSVVEASEKINTELSENGIEVLFDDRVNLQAGFKFSDADLLGMPLQIIVGERGLKENQVELKVRASGERINVKLDELNSKVNELLNK